MADEDNETPPPDPSLPPEPPGSAPDNEAGDNGGEPIDDQDEAFLTRTGPTLGTGPGKVIAFGAIMVVVVVFVFYNLFFNKPIPQQNPEGTATNPSRTEVSGPAPLPASLPAAPIAP